MPKNKELEKENIKLKIFIQAVNLMPVYEKMCNNSNGKFLCIDLNEVKEIVNQSDEFLALIENS
jgi:hypothetical protein